MEATFIVIGGGIAGVSCVETLAFLQPEAKIILISESSLIKATTNLLAITQTLTQFDIEEKSAEYLTENHENVMVVHDKLIEINTKLQHIRTENHLDVFKYQYLCLCLGAKPKLIDEAADNPLVLGIRDTDSVEKFIDKLSKAKNVAIVGNGGIASELVYKMTNVNVDWIIKDDHITSTFVDPGASEFFRSTLMSKTKNNVGAVPSKRMRYGESDNSTKYGAALGPDWYKRFDITGANSLNDNVTIHYKTTVNSVTTLDSNDALELTLSNGTKLKSDLIVSATGVEARTDFLIDESFETAEDGIKVNEFMETNVRNVFAAGDICSAAWSHSRHWFQMKLWTQARQMGCYAAKCMSARSSNETIYQDFCFELFAHTTKLFGYKVVLIGLFNGQKLGDDYEILLRTTKELEYVKFVLKNGKLQGAVLIGETDLEETCENLILNEIDLSLYKEDLLNPNIDIEDYFD